MFINKPEHYIKFNKPFLQKKTIDLINYNINQNELSNEHNLLYHILIQDNSIFENYDKYSSVIKDLLELRKNLQEASNDLTMHLLDENKGEFFINYIKPLIGLNKINDLKKIKDFNINSIIGIVSIYIEFYCQKYLLNRK